MANTLSRTADQTAPRQSSLWTEPREWLICRWLNRIKAGCLTVEFPSGTRAVFEGAEPGPHASLTIRNLRLVTRLVLSGDIGFAESHMAGEWDTQDLSVLLTLGAVNADAFSIAIAPSPIMRIANRLYHAFRTNTRRGSRRNIAAHYDLGNDFYGQWLDETMTYSSALFATPDENLAAAQRRKYLRLAEQLELSPGDRVLEIGCGWGGFAEIAAAKFGCQVVGLTLSVEQAAYARERMQRAGISDAVEIRIQDYRDVKGQFDKIVSVEMFEAVGEKYWPDYLQILHARLKPQGKAALQIITIDDDNFDQYRSNPDFIQRYIFPGGMLPGPKAFENAVARTPLLIRDAMYFGESYAETLRRWDRDFQHNWPRIASLGFDDRFYRMWRYYFCYCEVGFDTREIDVAHFLLERP